MFMSSCRNRSLKTQREVVDVVNDMLLNLLEEFQTGLRTAETHLAAASANNLPVEERAELRGREKAYRTHTWQLKRTIQCIDRAGKSDNIAAALYHIEAAQRLVNDVEVSGYKAEYSKGISQDSLIASKRAVVGLWGQSPTQKTP